MALDDELRRLMGFDQGPDNNAEVNIKIKPLGQLGPQGLNAPGQPPVASDPTLAGGGTLAGGTGGAGDTGGTQQSQLNAPTGPQGPTGFGAGGQSIVPQNQRLRRANPTLVAHPLGAQTDDIYEAAVANLQFDTTRQYMQLLADLGWMDDAGNFIPGLLETEAVRRRGDINFERDQALKQVIDQAVRGSTVFSGPRARNQSIAQRPYDAALSNLETTLGRELSQRYSGLGELTRGFELSRNALIAEAAERARQAALTGPVGGDGGPPPAAEPPPQQQMPTATGMPGGAKVVYDPSVGYYVADQWGRRIGRVVDGRFVREGGPPISPYFAGLGGYVPGYS